MHTLKTRIGLLTGVVLLAVMAVLALPGTSGAAVTRAQASSCSWQFQGSVRVGPSVGTNVQGMLTVQVGQGGDLTGSLATDDNKTIPMVGQIVGHAINVAFQLQ